MSKSLDKNGTITEGMFKSPDKDWVPVTTDIFFELIVGFFFQRVSD